MPLFSVTVQDDDVKIGLAAIGGRARDLTSFWIDVFAPDYFARVQDLFAMEGQSRGAGGRLGRGHWEPLSPAYAAWKRRHFPGTKILERTGALRASLEWSGSGLGAGGFFQPTPTRVMFGTDIPYGKYHQHGGGRMPQREFMPTPDTVIYSRLLRNWLLSGATTP